MSPGLKHQIERSFTYHPPIGTQPQRYEMIRAKARELAGVLANLCPESRELSLAMTNLEQACFWANASIARNEIMPEESDRPIAADNA